MCLCVYVHMCVCVNESIHTCVSYCKLCGYFLDKNMEQIQKHGVLGGRSEGQIVFKTLNILFY